MTRLRFVAEVAAMTFLLLVLLGTVALLGGVTYEGMRP